MPASVKKPRKKKLTAAAASAPPLLTERDIRNRPEVIPLIVAYGMGWDSTCMLVEFHKRGIYPDVILFADTGDELQPTYDYLPVIQKWLRSVGFPPVVTVRTNSKYKGGIRESCLKTETLPSLAFGMKTCSLRWKVSPQNAWLNKWPLTRACWRSGYKAIKCIGYDATPRERERYCESLEEVQQDDKYTIWCPLIEWGIMREDIPAIIQGAGLPMPIKSSCGFCPARKREEIIELATLAPHRLKQAIEVERTWKTGKHPKGSTKGLGRSFSWEDFLQQQGVPLE